MLILSSAQGNLKKVFNLTILFYKMMNISSKILNISIKVKVFGTRQ